MAGLPDTNIEYTMVVSPSCPAGTAAASYQTVSVPALNNVYLWEWEVRIPPGHAGVTGIALIDSGIFILPYSSAGSQWIIGDNDLLHYPYQKQTGANVKVAVYNTSTLYAHGWQTRFIYTQFSDMTISVDAIDIFSGTNWPQAIESSTGGG